MIKILLMLIVWILLMYVRYKHFAKLESFPNRCPDCGVSMRSPTVVYLGGHDYIGKGLGKKLRFYRCIHCGRLWRKDEFGTMGPPSEEELTAFNTQV